MANLVPTPSWDDVYQIEQSDRVLGGPGGVANRPTQELLNRTELLRNYAALPFVGGREYQLNERVQLDNGDIVRNIAPDNTTNPNTDMAGWVRIDSASQIFDESGENQQDINNSIKFSRGNADLKTPQSLHTGGLFLFEADSLTEGAGGSSFLNYFIKSARANFGDGGPGYHCFDNGIAAFYGVGWFKTGGCVAIEIDDDLYGKYAPGGRGVYVASGSGSDYVNWGTASRWDNVDIVYLAQPGGGSFKYRLATTPGSLSVSVNTGTVNPDGTGGSVTAPTIKKATLSHELTTQQILVIEEIAGDVAVFGGDFKLSSNPDGFRSGMLAKGGRSLQSVAAQDMNIRQQWIAILDPVAYQINAGMNDRITRTAAQHETDLTKILDANIAGKPAILNKIVMCNESSDYDETYLKYYSAVKIDVARDKNASFFDVRSVLGSYTDASENGLMLDGVHPNDKANALISAGLCNSWGFASSGKDEGATGFTGGSGEAQQFKGVLETKNFETVALGTAQNIYNIGLVNGYPIVVFKLLVCVNRIGTSQNQVKEVSFSLTNGTVLNQANDVGSVFSNTVINDASSGDFTVSAAIVSDRLIFSVTPTSYESAITVSGEWTCILKGSGGTIVFEN